MTRFTIAKTGEVFDSNLTRGQVLSGLAELREKGNGFAQSLLKSHHRGWSDQQEAWAHKIVLNPVKPEPQDSGHDYAPIVALFAKASTTLKYPRITFKIGENTVRLQRAGHKSQYNGQLMVTDGRRYPDNLYYGRIDEDGRFFPGSDFDRFVLEFLDAIAASPASALGNLGLESGNCCFCNKDLVAEESTHVGYGPVCAKNWGLPWGHVGKPVKVGGE